MLGSTAGLSGVNRCCLAPCLLKRSCGSSCLVGVLEAQNHVNDSFIADCSVHHGVVNRPVRPFDIEIFLNKIGALAVDVINELFGFLLAFAASQQPAHFVFSWGIKKHTQSVCSLLKKLL